MSLLNAWKFFNKGLIASRDESKVIGTFHVAADHPEKNRIRNLVLHAEALEIALRRLHDAHRPDAAGSPESQAMAYREADELLEHLARA